jgi:hypothetical protein
MSKKQMKIDISAGSARAAGLAAEFTDETEVGLDWRRPSSVNVAWVLLRPPQTARERSMPRRRGADAARYFESTPGAVMGVATRHKGSGNAG